MAQKLPKMAQKLPKIDKMAQKLPQMAQKLAPAKKNSRDISPVSTTFCISVKGRLWGGDNKRVFIQREGIPNQEKESGRCMIGTFLCLICWICCQHCWPQGRCCGSCLLVKCGHWEGGGFELHHNSGFTAALVTKQASAAENQEQWTRQMLRKKSLSWLWTDVGIDDTEKTFLNWIHIEFSIFAKKEIETISQPGLFIVRLYLVCWVFLFASLKGRKVGQSAAIKTPSADSYRAICGQWGDNGWIQWGRWKWLDTEHLSPRVATKGPMVLMSRFEIAPPNQ